MSRYLVSPSTLGAAETWRQKCLLGEMSVFSQEQLWTASVLGHLEHHFSGDPDIGKEDFLAKLEKQLSDAPPEAAKLAAEMIWFMYLFPSRTSISIETKRSQVKRVWEWSKTPLPEGSVLLGDDTLGGIGSVGAAYNTQRYRELSFFISMVTSLKSLPIQRRQALLADAWQFATWIYGLVESKGRQLRHIVLFLLFPDTFEHTSSGRQKRQIVEGLWSKKKSAPIPDLDDPITLDRALLELRNDLQAELKQEVDFYRSPVVEQWQEEPVVPPGSSGDANRAWAEKFLKGSRVWAIGCGKDASLWNRFAREEQIAIGWEELGDLNEYKDRAEIAEELRKLAGPDAGLQTNNSLACWQFAREMKTGDIVIAKQGRSTLFGMGRVKSEYVFDSNRADHPNIRKVSWEKIGNWEIPSDQQITTKTLTEMTGYHVWLRFVFDLMGSKHVGEVKPESSPKKLSYGREDALLEVFLTAEEVDSAMRSMAQRKAIMLAGPPGVGKTFIARRLAWMLLGSRESSPKMEMIQFHSGYSYEDFIQGWRPAAGGRFELKDGKFKSFCDLAAQDENPSSSWVFCIDEINRANLSKVFGETMTLLEADKRGPAFSMRLQYSPQDSPPFFIPGNVYLIGMMNTADRSIAMVDYALRRRFAFHKILPAFGTEAYQQFLRDRGVEDALVDRIVTRLGNLNDAICTDRNLGPGYAIGHSYFCPPDTEEEADEVWYRRVVEQEVGPLLCEYWFEQPEVAEERIKGLLA
jgi:5-methylcytosine-specific restriction enzyme B